MDIKKFSQLFKEAIKEGMIKIKIEDKGNMCCTDIKFILEIDQEEVFQETIIYKEY